MPDLFTFLGLLLFVPLRFELSAVEDAALGVGFDDGEVRSVTGEGDGLVAACRCEEPSTSQLLDQMPKAAQARRPTMRTSPVR